MSIGLRIVFCPVVLLLFGLGQGDPPPEHVAKYLRRCEQLKQAAVEAAQNEIKRLADPSNTSPEAAKNLEQARGRLKQLQEGKPPFARLPLPPAKGNAGIFELPAKADTAGDRSLDVLEVVDGGNAIVRAWYASDTGPTFVDLWVEGIDAGALAEGMPARLTHVFEVVGNKSFGTTCGQRSLPLLRPLDIERYLPRP
jgi:hypothetical protein